MKARYLSGLLLEKQKDADTVENGMKKKRGKVIIPCAQAGFQVGCKQKHFSVAAWQRQKFNTSTNIFKTTHHMHTGNSKPVVLTQFNAMVQIHRAA